MSIDFSRDRWEKIAEDAARWWTGDLERPLIQIRLRDRDSRGNEMFRATVRFTSYERSVPAEVIIGQWDEDLSRTRFAGDAFPTVFPDFGPGVIAGFLGAKPDVRPDTVWFHPPADLPIADIRFEYDPDNVCLQRIKDIYRAAVDRWAGLVQISMTDLGGSLDIPSTFRPGEKLLLDLVDYPDHVKRLTWDAHNLWWKYLEEFNDILKPTNPGYTAWASIFSADPHYMLQCDFCYMISPEMFDEFVKPELVESCRRLGNAFYHLDGPGQLCHLDSLLTIDELKGIQWIPGAGRPDWAHWPEVYRKIRDAGKLVQLFGTMDTLDAVADQLGSARGIVMIADADISQEREVETFLAKYGAT